MIYNLQVHLNPRWRLIIDRDACAAFWKLNKLNKDVFRGFLSEKFSISLSVVIMKRSSGQFGDYFSGFGRSGFSEVKNLVALAPVSGAISPPGGGWADNVTALDAY